MNASKKGKAENFYDTYLSDIAPIFMKVDMLAKTSEKYIPVSSLAEALGIKTSEIISIMNRHNISTLSRSNIHYVLSEGTSAVCGFFRREVERGVPLVYTMDDISYIYDIDKKQLEDACCELGITETTSYNLPLIFSRLPAKAI